MSNYTNLADSLQNYINEIYRITRDDNKTMAFLAEILEEQLSKEDIEKLYFHIGVDIEVKEKISL